MEKFFDTTENGRTITNIIPDDMVEVFGDGFGPMLIGFPNTKVSVFRQQISDPSSGKIERKIVATIQVPTLNLIELGRNMDAILKNNSEQLRAVRAQIDTILADQKPSELTPSDASTK